MTNMPKGHRTKEEIHAKKRELSARNEAVGEADEAVLKLAGVYK